MASSRLQARSNLRPFAYAATMICVAQAACTHRVEGETTQERVGQAIQPIIHGSASDAAHDAVVLMARFEDAGRKSLCTGTLVAPNLVLTARHCVSVTDSSAMCGQNGQPVVGALLHGERNAADYAIFVGNAGVAAPSTDETKASARGKAIVVDEATSICNHDVAFLVLDRALAAPIAPIRFGPPVSGEEVTAVGWGITEAGTLPSTRLARPDVTLVGAGPMPYPDDARYGVGDRELLFGESVCSGDSGSPMLAPSGAVVGVASRAGNGKPRDPANWASVCTGDGVRAIYTHLTAFRALADEAFAKAGATPWIEGDADPRAPARDGGPAEAGAAAPASTPTLETSAATAPAAPAEGAAAGCSLGARPADDLVGRAIGATALLATLARLLRRRLVRG